jgi:hypothetical protein
VIKVLLDHIDQVPIVRVESEFLRVEVAPSVGGRIVSLVDKKSGYDFLWRNANLRLEKLDAYSEYDPNFYGGIDELLPNDIPEEINGLSSPDHGELWTTALDHRIEGDELIVNGTLPLCGLAYERRMALHEQSPQVEIHYRIANPTTEERRFLWKLHAALNIEAGDQILCPARTAQVPDLAWSRWQNLEPFAWPLIDGQRADVVPPVDGSVDFLYLYNLEAGCIACQSHRRGLKFEYQFDTHVFPYTWYFASYGGFNGHYTAILEPCTTMPISVNQAANLGQCSILAPGGQLETTVAIHAGPAAE